MAYIDNYVSGFRNYSSMTAVDMMTEVTNFMINNFGATVQDQISTTNTVFKIQYGEKYQPYYVGIACSSNYIYFSVIAQGWNNTTHTGIRTISGLSTTSLQYNTQVYIWMGPGMFIMQNVNGSGTYGVGTSEFALIMPKNFTHDGQAGLTTSPITSGSNVVIPLDNLPSDFSVGMYVQVSDIAGTQGTEQVLIASIGTNSITVSSLARSYPIGTSVNLGFYLGVCPNSNYVLTSSAFWGNASSVALSSLYAQNNSSLYTSWITTEGVTNKYFICPFLWYGSASVYAYYDMSVCIGITSAKTANDFFLLNNDGTTFISGTATVGTTTTLQDTTKSWGENVLVGKKIVIIAGAANQSCRTIIANTDNTITVNRAFPTSILNTSQYSIADIVHRVQSGAFNNGTCLLMLDQGS